MKIHDGEKWALLGNGTGVGIMLDTRDMAGREGVDVPAVYDVRRVKPVDADAARGILRHYDTVAVVEDNYMAGGFGEALGAIIAEGGYDTRLLRFGVPDVCVKHATQSEQRELYGLTARNILDRYKNEE